MFLIAKSSNFIIAPLATLLGYIMEGLFKFTGIFGVQNIGLSIILFTFVTKLLMMPLTVKQQKFTKMSALMNPELQAIMEKYRDKRDNESMLKMRQEQKDVYEKYGTSQSAGCLQLLIQFPIIFALYDVIRNIPSYVLSVKVYFTNIIGTSNTDGLYENIGIVKEYVADNEKASTAIQTLSKAETVDDMINALNTFGTSNWNNLAEIFENAGHADLAATIIENSKEIISMNSFFGIDLASAPNIMSIAIMIPILAGLSQWFSLKLSQVKNEKKQGKYKEPENNPMASMNVIMPVLSAIMCITFPAGIGIYWIAQSVAQILTQLAVNLYFDKHDIDEIVAKNIEKANKKREKQGLPVKNPTVSKNIANNAKINASKRDYREVTPEERQKKIEKSTAMYKDSSKGSIAEKAAMVKKYNETHNKK